MVTCGTAALPCSPGKFLPPLDPGAWPLHMSPCLPEAVFDGGTLGLYPEPVRAREGTPRRRGEAVTGLSGRSGRRLRLAALAWLSMVGAVGAADQLPLPPLAPLEGGTYRARDLQSGEPLWEERWTLKQEARGARSVVHLEEQGQGIRDRTMPTRWTLTMTIDLWGPAPRVSSTKEVWDLAGQPVAVEERTLEYGSGTGSLRIRDPRTGEATSRAFRVTTETVTPEFLPAMLRLLPATPDQQMQLDLVTHSGSVLGLQARIVGQERVEVPAGTYDCFKVELVPTGITGLLARVLLPKLFMWHAVAAPHIWIKFQGPAAGVGSPEIVRELTEFQATANPAG